MGGAQAVVGTSEPVKIARERVNGLAQATGDFQWMQVDAERAADWVAAG